MATEEQSSERSTLAAVMEIASADKRDWDGTIQRILRLEAQAFGVARVSFWEVQEAKGEVLAFATTYETQIGAFVRGPVVSISPRSDYLGAVTDRPPLAIPNVREDRRLDPVRAYLDAHAIASELDCPVWLGGQLSGILSVEHTGAPRQWTLYDEYLAATMAQTVSASLEARARTTAQQSLRRMAFLERASRALSGTLEVDEVCRRAVELVVPTDVDGARIALLGDGPPRVVVTQFRTPEGRAALEAAMRNGTGDIGYIARLAAESRNPIFVPDVTHDAFVEAEQGHGCPDLAATFARLGVKSLLAVPLISGDACIGVVTVYDGAHGLGLDLLANSEEFAEHLAAALSNAELHERVRAALRARDEFIALAGHELRTPLTALQLTAQDLALRAPDAKVRRSAERMVQLVKRLDRLASQMLEAARAAAGEARFVPHPAPTDLVAVTREAAAVLTPICERNGCAILVHADEPVVGQWDAGLLETMLSSLLDNATKFGAGKPIEVTIRREDGAATLSVTDHGLGIPPDRVESVFEPFERAVPANNYGGLGLGLFVAREIASAHGGALTVDNHPGKGVTFTARLPLAPRGI
jgi:signal transduction histidine kinase